MNPQIEFKHVLGELSVNRNDPCEVLRELISNSYDAQASHIVYIPLKDHQGLAFLDYGTGLNHQTAVNEITPWEAFFSIGKSTKKQGDSIGYKCQVTLSQDFVPFDYREIRHDERPTGAGACHEEKQVH